MRNGPDFRVGEMMTADPATIDGMATINEALAIMRERNINSLVVRRRDADDEYGLLLISDIARGISTNNRPVSRIQVYEIMQKPAPAVDAEMKLKYAIRYMTRFGISHSVVLSGRELAGIVSLRDLTIRLLDREDRPRNGVVNDRIQLGMPRTGLPPSRCKAVIWLSTPITPDCYALYIGAVRRIMNGCGTAGLKALGAAGV